MKTRKVFPKKAFPPHCAKRHVNLEMGYSWYNTVIWAKRKSAPTLSKCVSPRSGVSKGLFPTLFPKSLQYIAVAERWAVVYHVCICILFIMQGPLLCVCTDYGVTDSTVVVSTYEVEDFFKFLADFWLIIENEKKKYLNSEWYIFFSFWNLETP